MPKYIITDLVTKNLEPEDSHEEIEELIMGYLNGSYGIVELYNECFHVDVRSLVVNLMSCWHNDLDNNIQHPDDWYLRGIWCRDHRVMILLGTEEHYWAHEKCDHIDLHVGIRSVS